MATLSFALVAAPGIASDDTTFAAEGRWADGSNVRFRGGYPETIGGWTLLTSSVGSVVNIFGWNAGGLDIAYGGGSTLYTSQEGNITPTGLPSGYTAWAFASFGTILLAAPRAGKLYKYDNETDLRATQVTQAPSQINWMIVTPERQVLALGCNEEVSTDFNGLCIRGSDLEDYTDWTTSATNNAFEHILDNGGSIVSARLIGSYVAVWTQTDLYIGQFIGDPGQTYRFDHVGEGGLIGPNAVCVEGETAYWVTPDLRLFAWQPGALPAPIPCPIGKDFIDHVTVASRGQIIVEPNKHYGEIWVYYPDSRDGGSGNTRYIAYSVAESAAAERAVWSRGAMVRTAVSSSDTISAYLISQSYSVGSFISANGTSVYAQEHGTTAGGSALAWFIQSADQYVDNGHRRTMVTRLIPDFEYQSGDVSLTVYMRDRPQSTAVTKGPYTLANTATKKDFRASGMLAAFKFSGSSVSARLGKPLFDYVLQGGR